MNPTLTVDEPRGIFSRNFNFLCLSSLSFFGSFYLLLPILPLYVVSMGATDFEVGLIMGAFTVAAVVLRPFVGRGVDERGRKMFLIVGALIFMPTSLLFSFANTVPLVLLVRMVQGAGMAVFFTAAAALAADLAPMRRRGEAMGVFGSAGNVAMAAGPALGVVLLDAWDFRITFLVAASLAVCSVLFSGLLGERKRPKRSVDIPRGVLFSRRALFPSLLAFCYATTYGAIASFIALFAKSRGIDNSGFYFFTVYAIALLFSRVVAGRLSDRFGRMQIIAPGLLINAVAMAFLVFVHSPALLAVAAVLYGLGFGAVHPTIMALITDRADRDGRGAAMSTFGGAIDLGIGLGSVGFGLILQLANFETMFLVAAIGPLVGFVVLVLFYSRLARPRPLAVVTLEAEGE